MRSHIDVKDASGPDLHDHQHIDKPKCCRRDNEKVGRNDCLGMIAHESHPPLRRNRGTLRLHRHVTTDGAAKSESRFSTKAHWRCVPRPRSDCWLPSRRSTFADLEEL